MSGSGNTFTYSLVSGTGSMDNGSFTISGNTLQTAAAFNYEVKNSYHVRICSTDQGGLWCEKPFVIGVTEAPKATWDGGGTDDNWKTAENWADDVAPVPGDDDQGLADHEL